MSKAQLIAADAFDGIIQVTNITALVLFVGATLDTQSPLYQSFVNECADNIKDVYEACQAHTKEVHPHYTQVFHTKREQLEDQQRHLNVGLEKLRETAETVAELQSSLSARNEELSDLSTEIT